MNKTTVLGLAALALLAVPCVPAQAGVRIGIGIGIPVYRPYYRPYYVVPAPVYVQPAPVYVVPPPQRYWYFCQSFNAYYPQAQICPEPWVMAPAQAY